MNSNSNMAAEKLEELVPQDESKTSTQQIQDTNTTDQLSETSNLVTSSQEEPDFAKGIIACRPIHHVRYMYNDESITLAAQQYLANLSLEEKRKLYTCGDNFVTLDQILTWHEAKQPRMTTNGTGIPWLVCN